jgi:hypothetical protein
MAHEPSSLPRKIIIEEEIVNDREAPRVLYSSSTRPSLPTASRTLSTAPSSRQTNIGTTISPPSSRERPILPPQRALQDQREEEGRDEAEYQYNLIIDEGGTRWMPIAERAAATAATEPKLSSEKYQLKQRTTATDKRKAQVSQGSMLGRLKRASSMHSAEEEAATPHLRSLSKMSLGPCRTDRRSFPCPKKRVPQSTFLSREEVREMAKRCPGWGSTVSFPSVVAM